MNGSLLLSHSVTATLLFGAVNAQIDALNASRTTLQAVGSTWRSFPTRELLTAPHRRSRSRPRCRHQRSTKTPPPPNGEGGVCAGTNFCRDPLRGDCTLIETLGWPVSVRTE